MVRLLADAGPTGAGLAIVGVIMLALFIGFIALVVIVVRAIRRR